MAQSSRPPKLLDQLRGQIRVRHLARSTERAHVPWVRRFILFHNKEEAYRDEWMSPFFAAIWND